MAWLRNPNITDGQVSVNTKIFEFKHSLVQVEDPEDIRIFREYLHCEEIPEELAKNLIAEAEAKAKEPSAGEEDGKSRKKKG